MLVILDDKTICITRGDIAHFDVSASLKDGSPYVFRPGDIVRFQVFKKKDCAAVMLKKDFTVEESAYPGYQSSKFFESVPLSYSLFALTSCLIRI